MKRIVAIILILPLIFASCGKEQTPEYKTESYRYERLDEEKRHLYDIFAAALAQHEDVVRVKGCSYEDVKAVITLIMQYDERFFYVNSRFSFTEEENSSAVRFDYLYDRQTTERMQEEICRETASVLAGGKDLSPPLRVMYIHDELIKRISYGSGENETDIYGALVRHTATCQGYSKAFVYVCRAAGIEALTVSGDADGPHMWDMVMIEGEYYHIDLVFDETDSLGFIRYDYYGLDDEEICRYRRIEDDVPAAAGQEFNYFDSCGLCVTSYEEAEELLIRKLAPDDHIARMRADDNYDEIVSTLFGDGVSGGTIEDIADMCISGEHDIQYTLNDEHHIITVHLGPAEETEGEE